MQFRFHVFGFWACADIKWELGYEETDPDVQFMDDYLDYCNFTSKDTIK